MPSLPFRRDMPAPEHRTRKLDERREPPVVARLMVEVRSDGTHTIARGALEDLANGERAAVEASGGTPAAVAAALLKSAFSAPLLGRLLVRRLLGGR